VELAAAVTVELGLVQLLVEQIQAAVVEGTGITASPAVLALSSFALSRQAQRLV
jgi:hypothetical protein